MTASGMRRIDVPHRRLADAAYEQLIDAIASGYIGPSERLVQERLATELGISRTPLREALLRLEQERVLERAGRAGFRLRHATATEVEQIYRARGAIESDAARYLAERGTADDIAEIERVITEEESVPLDSAADYYDSIRRIHREFVARTDNPYLLDMFDLLWNQAVSVHLFTSTMSEEALLKSDREHRELLAGIQGCTGDEAAATMREHIANGLQIQLAEIADSTR
ncbi:GntR family transcriptional regulator [Leekyejoonella antrihumi]|uniref:GntR family transcriptional regulator n=1 Tax=Leekyejoonella antrihumi TaxID=1660198 RepID=A0A563DRK6_9MICO|nr:GntR family transcriptional regulator [Leekyejoonella antrihumi]TWP32572.1 GntR family transcriptional regulator [Leekyejoonella antrihumi]